MSDELTVAIVGLVGVIIGGLLNGGVTYLMEQKRGKHALKTASRLLYQEMMVNAAAIEVTAYHKEWKQLKEHLVTDAWKANQDVLAGGLPDAEWSRLIRAYYWIETLIGEGRDKTPNQVVDVDHVAFQEARVNLHAVGPSLQARAGVTDPFVPWNAHMPPEGNGGATQDPQTAANRASAETAETAD